MKSLKLILIALLAIALTTSCGIGDDDTNIFGCEKGTGGIVTDTLDVVDFNGIELDCAATVYLTQGNDFEVIVEGQQNMLDLLETDVDNDVWEIKFKDCVKDGDDVEIYITMPEITYLKACGSGEIKGENTFDVGDMVLRVSGSGDIDVDIEADDIDGKISGSGKLILEGSGDDFDFEISGSGKLKAFPLEVNKMDIKIRGSGDAEVFTNEELKVKISGSGDVYYKGFPTIEVDISGSGDVINSN